MKTRAKPKRWSDSPAACLLPQLREKKGHASGRRIRKFYESDSPGKLFTYVSAGNIETPAVDYEREIAMKNDVDAEQKLVEFGNEIVELNDEQRNEFKEKLLPVADMVKEKASAEIVDLFVGSSK